MKYEQAVNFATSLAETLSISCTKIEIVGSVKRDDKPEVHDIEILLIPRPGHPTPVFGMKEIHTTHLDRLLFEMRAAGILKPPSRKADGPKYKKFAICDTGEPNEFCLDLFIVNEKTWGLQNVICTGPGLFSHRFVTNQNKTAFDHTLQRGFPGFLPNHLSYVRDETCIRNGSVTLSLPEERDAIELLGHGWIPPNERSAWALR